MLLPFGVQLPIPLAVPVRMPSPLPVRMPSPLPMRMPLPLPIPLLLPLRVPMPMPSAGARRRSQRPSVYLLIFEFDGYLCIHHGTDSPRGSSVAHGSMDSRGSNQPEGVT